MAEIIEYSSYAVTLICVGIAVHYWMRQRIRPWRRIGFFRGRLLFQDLTFGSLLCVISVSAILFIEWTSGLIKLQAGEVPLSRFLLFLLFLFSASFLEEFIGRGLMINGLKVIFRKNWIIFLIVAVMFGFSHSTGPGAGPMTVLSSAVGGIIYTLAFIGTGTLWLPWTLHFFWNSMQFVFGFAVSGMQVESFLVLADIKTPILSGGSYGPEAGLIGLFFRLVILLSLLLYLKRTRSLDWRALLGLRDSEASGPRY